MTVKMSRNVVIDLFRVVFALVVVLHHYFPQRYCGYLAVDFFFVVSGFFLIKSFKKYDDSNRPHNLRFCFHKLMAFLPYLIVAEIAAAIIFAGIQVSKDGNWDTAMGLAWSQLRNILCLSMLNIYEGDVTWYLSAMIIATALLYPCLCKFKEQFSKFVAPVIGFAILLAILIGTGRTNFVDELIFGFICKGLLLGISNMCLGIFAYEIVEYLKRYESNQTVRIASTVIEAICYLTVLICIFAVQPRGESWREAFEFIMIVLLFVGVTVTLSNLSLSYNVVSKQAFLVQNANILATGSLMIYLNHQYIVRLWKYIKPDIPDFVSVMIVIIMTVAVSIGCYYLGKLLYNRMKKIDVNKMLS